MHTITETVQRHHTIELSPAYLRSLLNKEGIPVPVVGTRFVVTVAEPDSGDSSFEIGDGVTLTAEWDTHEERKIPVAKDR